MPIVTKQIRVDRHYKYQIYAVGNREKDRLNCPTLEFFTTLKQNDPAELAKLAALLTFIANNGPPAMKRSLNRLQEAQAFSSSRRAARDSSVF